MSKANSGVIVSYSWDFGDGNATITTDSIIIHVYDIYGNYTVTLTVLNSEGLSTNKTNVLNVAGCPPEANFDWQPIHPLVNQTATFNASISDPNGGIIVSYKWDFGDGSSPIVSFLEPTITHEYLAYGNYTVTLNVTDSEKLSVTVSKVIMVVAPPYASFTWSPQSPETYETVEFNASTSLPNGGNIVSYVWDFGDGNITTVTNSIITHVYKIAGNYTVTLKVTDNQGLWNVATEIIKVTSAAAPKAEFAYSPEPPYVFEIITFNASMSTTSVGTIMSYSWDFGDGNMTTVSVPVITLAYNLEGNYTVVLSITTDVGLNASTSKLITILPISGPTARLTWFPTSPACNQTVTFNATLSFPGWNGTVHAPIAYYVWDFGDGNLVNTTDSIVYHIFSQLGNYTVQLTVIDINGQSDAASALVQVLESLKIYDVNGDGFIDMADIAIAARAYGSAPGDPHWDPRADINHDDFIDMSDISAIARHYGEDP